MKNKKRRKKKGCDISQFMSCSRDCPRLFLAHTLHVRFRNVQKSRKRGKILKVSSCKSCASETRF